MSIDPAAVKAFFKRPRDSHDWLKDVSATELDQELDRLGFSTSKNVLPLNKHQKICVLLGISYPRFGHWVDMGGGKTRISLELIRYWYGRERINGCLILAPSESALISWENQLKEWHINLPHTVLWNSSTQEKLDVLEQFKSGLLLCTYAGLPHLLSILVKQKGKKKRKLQPNAKRLRMLLQKIDALVMDESTKALNRRSLTWRLCNRIKKKSFVLYELAGRPLGRDPTALWSQLNLLDDGHALGETLGLYRAAFFTEKPGYFGGTQYKFEKRLEPDLARVIKHRSITFEEKEYRKPGKVVHTLEEVTLPEEASIYYQKFLKQLKASYGGFIERQNTFVRMRQLSSGFIGVTDDDSGAKIDIEFAANPKLDRLMELIEEVPAGCKFVVFYEFIHSGHLIRTALKKAGIKFGALYGGIKNAREVQDRFDHDDNYPGLVVNTRLGAYALNLQRANFVFVFEAPVPCLDNDQMRKRVDRPGQTRTVYEYDLCCKGTVDLRILAFHASGESLWQALKRRPETVI